MEDREAPEDSVEVHAAEDGEARRRHRRRTTEAGIHIMEAAA